MEYVILFLPLVGSILTGFLYNILGEKIAFFKSGGYVLTAAF